MTTPSDNQSNKPELRLALRVLVKLLLLAAVVSFLWVLCSPLLRSTLPQAEQRVIVDIAGLAVGEVKYITVQQREYLIMHRSRAMLDCLLTVEPYLFDPKSHLARQPSGLAQAYRSLQPAYFIALAHEPDLACPIRQVFDRPDKDALPEAAAWCGGFQDQCRGSVYDPAGRVYAKQAGERNLSIPEYHWQDKQLHINAQ